MGFKIWERFKTRMTYGDYVLIKLSCVAFGMMLVAWIPPLRKINGWWYLIASLLLTIKPLHTAFKK